ncbi:MAG: hypothetical protein KGL94_00335 [Acidobacteriota bacterium]|nr:hypothetical protein [Acidobacteriota bacterium]
MHRSLALALVSTLAVASAALAADGRAGAKASLVRADRVTTLRYVIDLSLTDVHGPAIRLHVRGMRGRRLLSVRLSESSSAPGAPAQRQSAIIDGPFLYEGSPNGVPVLGRIRWVRVPLARLGPGPSVASTLRGLSPAPLLRVLDEWPGARSGSASGTFRGTVAYDDPIVLTALSTLSRGVEFRDIRFVSRIGENGFVRSILITGRTADGSRTLHVTAHLYAFGRPVDVTPPGEGTFVDEKLLGLAE